MNQLGYVTYEKDRLTTETKRAIRGNAGITDRENKA